MDTTLLLAADSGSWMFGLIGVLLGGGGGYVVLSQIIKSKQAARKQEADNVLGDARRTAENVVKAAEVEAKAEHIKRLEQFNTETAETRAQIKEAEKRLDKREDNLEKKLETLNSKERNVEQDEKKLAERSKKVAARETEVTELVDQQRAQLTRIAGMSVDEARMHLLNNVQVEIEHEAAELTERILTEAKDNAVSKARDITITAIQRYAAEHTCDSTVSTVDIPSDDMKGRVIGREGRNIRAFEKATGVDVIVDDTPGVVVVSAFDPVRREVARISLERLIQDGRIHPARIEELVEETRKQVEADILETGKKASVEANVGGLHRKQTELLGRMKFRTSYGQNVLRHSIEVAYLCQIMADELGLDGRLARRCGLLHDIGKAVDHEVEGGHPQIGADICKRFNERPEVLNAIAGHHGDVEATSPYTILVMAADAISASRPGDRESLERYVQRLQQLEEIAMGQPGVKQAYAIQAGREIRVIVDCNRVDDAGAGKIARDIAQRVEGEMTYPGEVKVTVLREMRAIEFALIDMELKLLCIGDVVGGPGRKVLTDALPRLIDERKIDCVIANVENAASGSGLTPLLYDKFLKARVDLMTLGDHVYRRRDIIPTLERSDRIVRPANLSPGAPGHDTAIHVTRSGHKVAVLCLLGRMYMNVHSDCPFHAVDRVLSTLPKDVQIVVLDMHAEASSEKVAMGWHLDGRVSLVFGTHTHIPTADETILPGGTGYISDLGMTGPYDSVLGRSKENVLSALINTVPSPFTVAEGDVRMCGVIATVQSEHGRCTAIERVCIRESA